MRQLPEETKDFLGKMYVRTNRSKLTRSSLKAMSKKFGESQMKSISTAKSRGQAFVHRSQADLLLSRSQHQHKVPITARQLAKLDPRLQAEDPYSSPTTISRALQARRSTANVRMPRPQLALSNNIYGDDPILVQ